MPICAATLTLSKEEKTILTRNEFIKVVNAGNDVMFEYSGKKFAIVMTENGADIADQKTCASRKTFADAAQLLDQYNIDGVPLASVLSQCEFTFIS